MSNETEEIYKRLSMLPRVTGFLIINSDGLAIKSTMDAAETLKYAGLVAPLVDKSRKTIREFVVDEEENADDDVEFLRIRTRVHEILIAPDGEFTMIAIQLPHEDGQKTQQATEDHDKGDQ